jgi:hypothetical protein
VVVIRSQYGLTNIKACENKNAFHFWRALILWYSRPMGWHFSSHFIHLVAWLFYICPVCRSVISLHHYSPALADCISFIHWKKWKPAEGTSWCSSPRILTHFFCSEVGELTCTNLSSFPLLMTCSLFPPDYWRPAQLQGVFLSPMK